MLESACGEMHCCHSYCITYNKIGMTDIFVKWQQAVVVVASEGKSCGKCGKNKGCKNGKEVSDADV